MILKEYLITGKKSLGNSMTLGYDGEGNLVEVKLQGDMKPGGRRFLLDRAPEHENMVANAAKANQWTVKPLEMDLSFDNFYELYGNKIDKKRAAAKWKKMPKEQKVKAILFIEKYHNHLKLQPGVQMMYPERYLNAERWND